MHDHARRFAENPILRPCDCPPSRADMQVECLLNPGAFRLGARTGLLLRVAERPRQEPGWVSTPLLDPASDGGIRILRIRADDPELQASDPRVFRYKGRGYLTTLSHLRLAWSDDGRRFVVDPKPTLLGQGLHENFGMEDCRVEFIEGRYWLTYTAVSDYGVGVGLISTTDWRQFTRHGLIFPPHNKDCALFPQKVGGTYWAFHRPSGLGLGGNFIWVSRSPDLHHWGDHRCVATTRPDTWDCERIGAGAAPIATPDGWLALYHGADASSRYCLGTLLLDRDNPAHVVGRGRAPVMQPLAPYEQTGFFGHVVFTNGQVLDGDRLTIYYGASDSVIGAAEFSVSDLLATCR